ncbi:tail fiber assembly protein [Herbaspirillum robiniae]|uniref:tail fiber assembly protein n=1 Tax=Herbaspirillum robiniae TaxID=2014887 RepID=UPI000F0A3270|nr:tail fiber assembly protein [Herbaspirillum robiniae]
MSTTPEIWSYHPTTLRLMRTQDPCYADPDPEVEGAFLYPGNSTPAKPGKDRAGKDQVIDLDAQKWSYVDALPSEADQEPADEMTEKQALAAAMVEQRGPLLRRATGEVERLHTLVSLKAATSEEAALLVEWQAYLVSLCRIELQPDFPNVITWPAVPGTEDVAGETETPAQA